MNSLLWRNRRFFQAPRRPYIPGCAYCGSPVMGGTGCCQGQLPSGARMPAMVWEKYRDDPKYPALAALRGKWW